MSEPAYNENAAPAQPVAANANPVHCAKCFQFNPREAEKCGACGAHLWVKCRKCGKKNARTASRCGKCRRDLHPLAFLAFSVPRNKLFRNRKRKRLLVGIALFLLTTISAWVLYKSLPEPDHSRPPQATPAY